jgi:hypothetical protein
LHTIAAESNINIELNNPLNITEVTTQALSCWEKKESSEHQTNMHAVNVASHIKKQVMLF